MCCYTPSMALGAQLPVRLDLDDESRLESIAKRTGTTKSALIRMLCKRFVDTCIEPDGSVKLPANIVAMLEDRDARSRPAPPEKSRHRNRAARVAGPERTAGPSGSALNDGPKK